MPVTSGKGVVLAQAVDKRMSGNLAIYASTRPEI